MRLTRAAVELWPLCGDNPWAEEDPECVARLSAVLAGTTGRGMWIGEALVDTRGRISRVWTIREVEIPPALPAFNKAITDAIRQWEFEPLQVNKVAVPVCLTVTINIDWS